MNKTITRRAASAKTAAKGTGSTRKNATGKSRKAATKTPIGAAVPQAPATPVMDRAYGLDSKAPYSGALTANRKHFSAFTVAGFVVTGCINLSASGQPTKSKGNPTLWGMVVGKVARGYWRKSGRIDDAGITVDGLNEIQARLSGKSKGYDTTLALVNTFADAMRKGGKVKIDDVIYTFTVEHAAMRK